MAVPPSRKVSVFRRDAQHHSALFNSVGMRRSTDFVMIDTISENFSVIDKSGTCPQHPDLFPIDRDVNNRMVRD